MKTSVKKINCTQNKYKKIALVAHDNMKDCMLEFVNKHLDTLSKFKIITTNSTGKVIKKILSKENIKVECLSSVKSGPIGGDMQIAQQIISNKIGLLIFFKNPLLIQAHESDIASLCRISDLYNIFYTTNTRVADKLMLDLEKELKSKKKNTEILLTMDKKFKNDSFLLQNYEYNREQELNN